MKQTTETQPITVEEISAYCAGWGLPLTGIALGVVMPDLCWFTASGDPDEPEAIKEYTYRRDASTTSDAVQPFTPEPSSPIPTAQRAPTPSTPKRD